MWRNRHSAVRANDTPVGTSPHSNSPSIKSNNIAVELRDVVKRFGEVLAVNHVSLQVQDGEF